MGWRAVYKDGTERVEGTHGRPVQDGEEGKLLYIAQEDYGRNVAVDLINGVILLDYESLEVIDGTPSIINPKSSFWICDDTNIVGDLAFYEFKLEYLRDENGRRILGEDGRYQRVKTSWLVPLVWRPIWFSRITNGVPTKIIGAQTTTPPEFGARNVKKMVMVYADGRIGID